MSGQLESIQLLENGEERCEREEECISEEEDKESTPDEYFAKSQIRKFEGIFQRLDINCDGQVSADELRKALKFMNIRVDKRVSELMVQDFSSSGKNHIDMDSFLMGVKSLFKEEYLDVEKLGVNLAEEEDERDADQQKSDLMKIFEHFDQDKNGSISKDEFASITRELKMEMTDAEIDIFINQADIDGDGDINSEEFITFFGPIFNQKK